MQRAFDEFFRAAMDEAGASPYPYQRRLAVEGLPELLRAPTGAGKTAAAVLPWMWRRLEHPDPHVRVGEARWLVFVLPLRSLVEQTAQDVRDWVANAGVGESVGVHVLMGGESHDPDEWQLDPGRAAVFVGTQDMIISRLLMRGYAESRAMWPVSFGLMNSGVQFVFDETQLMGPALPTSAQLQGLREKLGVAAPSRSMWMSATLAPDDICTVDHPEVRSVVELGDEDRVGDLAVRLDAVRRVERVEVSAATAAYPADVARTLLARHVSGQRTIAVFNTVDRAVAVRAALAKAIGRRGGPHVVLMHSRFRPPDRKRLMEVLKAPLTGVGQIVVSTQVLEAGVDISSRVLFTEAALFSSVVQRAGRCNRRGEFPDGAELLWAPPPGGRGTSAPYEEADVERAIEALSSLEGAAVTSTMLQEMPVFPVPVVHPVLRQRDLLQLFDTMPDLSGSDIDVSQWIRDSHDTTAMVAWREWPGGAPVGKEPYPARDELCPAPVRDLKNLVKERPGCLWALDVVEGAWRRAQSADIYPGTVLLTASTSGLYDPELGWTPKHQGSVAVVPASVGVPDAMGRDHSSCADRWVTLSDHLSDVEREVGTVADELAPLGGLSEEWVEAARLAGLYHDLGKDHRVFRNTVLRSCPDALEPPGPGPWAKSVHPMGRHERKYFRHELVSALALLHPDCHLLDGCEQADLVAYLAAAHHGKVRLSVRSMRGEAERRPPRVLGVEPADTVGPLDLPDGHTMPALAIDLSVLFLGGGPDGEPSWTQRTSRLLAELGPFRLAALEALVRVADWRASRSYRSSAGQDQVQPDRSASTDGAVRERVSSPTRPSHRANRAGGAVVSTEVPLRGLRATTLGSYLSSLGLLRAVAAQRNPAVRLRWAGDLPVLVGEGDADELAEWLVDSCRPSPLVSPWNAGSGFAGTGKSIEAEKTLARFEHSDDPRLAAIREATAAGRAVVATGRKRGWAGESLWAKEHKQAVISLCRGAFPNDSLPWIDVAAVLSGPEVSYNPLTGTGGNFGRQELSATYLQHLALVIGPDADREHAISWARAALTGAEDVPYKRAAVGQFDPGRAGGVLASIWGEPDKQGFANPWRTVLTCEGLLLFASAAVRRNAVSAGAAWPFTVHATPIGHATASAGETSKGEVWTPLWEAPAHISELERLFGEGRAQWAGAQARDGLLFALAIAALGVDRNLSAFRRFVIVQRLGESPVAVRANDVPVSLRTEQSLLADPYVWLSRLRRKDAVPAGVAALLRQCDQALFAAVTGNDALAVAGFVAAFGRLHEAVARSGRLRDDIAPYQPRQAHTWYPAPALAARPELHLASALVSLTDGSGQRALPALRPLLTRVAYQGRGARARLTWTDGPATGTELLGATLPMALAQAHRLHLQTWAADSRSAVPPPAGFRTGQDMARATVEGFVDGVYDDGLLADYLRGLLTLGWTIPQPADRVPGQTLAPALSVLLPFFADTPLDLVSTWGPNPPTFTANLRPRPDWISRLIAAGPNAVLDDALLRLQLAGCRPLVGRPPDRAGAVATQRTDGTRLAAALLLKVSRRDRIRALSAVTATRAHKRTNSEASAHASSTSA